MIQKPSPPPRSMAKMSSMQLIPGAKKVGDHCSMSVFLFFRFIHCSSFTWHDNLWLHPCCWNNSVISSILMAEQHSSVTRHVCICPLSVGISAVSTSWLLWIVLLWTQGYMCLFESQFCLDMCLAAFWNQSLVKILNCCPTRRNWFNLSWVELIIQTVL